MILVTGGTGFVGRHVLSRLVAEGRAVRAISRNPSACEQDRGIEWRRGDLSAPDTIRPAMEGVRVVIHAAAVLPGPRVDAGTLEKVNVTGTANLARLARDCGVKRLVHVSSAGVYGDGRRLLPHREIDPVEPGDAYERSKVAAEVALKGALAGSSVEWTILRPQGLYGSDRPATAAFFREVASRRIWIHGPARVIVHPTHVADLVEAVWKVLVREDLGGEIFNVAGERYLAFHELIGLIGERMGHSPRQFRLPVVVGWCAGVAGRLWPATRPLPGAIDRLARPVVNRAVSIDRARDILGFVPVSLDRGLRDTAKALRGGSAH